MNPRRRALLIFFAVAAATLIATPLALASAGGGSSNFGGGGGGFGGGGGGGGHGFALFILFELLFHIALLGHGLGALFLVALGLVWLFFTRGLPLVNDWWGKQAATHQHHTNSASRHLTDIRPGLHGQPTRERRVELAAAEAADTDPAFAADAVRAAASQLFMAVQAAWSRNDQVRLRSLVAPDLLVEWERRLDDFERRGWNNHIDVLGEPGIELIGLVHRGDVDHDHVVVHVDARLKDYVVDRNGRQMKRSGKISETTRLREFWTLGRRANHWVLTSIEQVHEGKHEHAEQIIATPWADTQSLRDESLVEGAVAAAVPEGTSVSEVADLNYTGSAQAAANDLSVADGRFSPDILEVATRRALAAWVEAIDGPDDALDAIASPAVKRQLLYSGDSSQRIRTVVRGPVIHRIRIVALDAGSTPATMTIEADMSGRRYQENRDTAAVVAGSKTRKRSFTEHWTMSLTGPDDQPWQISSAR